MAANATAMHLTIKVMPVLRESDPSGAEACK
jgi:hypothetical protein